MKATLRLKDYLKKNEVKFNIIPHLRTFTALETASAEKAPQWEVAKVVMVKIRDKDTMFVIPADRQVDLFKLSAELGTDDIHVEEEKEFEDLFPDCEQGAMPPFGALYHIPCYVDVAFENHKEIFFNAGSHEESIQLAMKDYLRLAEAEIGDYSVPK